MSLAGLREFLPFLKGRIVVNGHSDDIMSGILTKTEPKNIFETVEEELLPKHLLLGLEEAKQDEILTIAEQRYREYFFSYIKDTKSVELSSPFFGRSYFGCSCFTCLMPSWADNIFIGIQVQSAENWIKEQDRIAFEKSKDEFVVQDHDPWSNINE